MPELQVDSDDEEDVVGAGAFGDHGLHVKHQQQKPTRAGTKAIVKRIRT